MEEHTTFVLGAGASVDLGMPLGPDLAVRIYHRLSMEPTGMLDDRSMQQVVQILDKTHQFREEREHMLACRQIRKGIRLARSVDHFIDTRSRSGASEVALMAKVAIVREILDAERATPIYYEDNYVGQHEIADAEVVGEGKDLRRQWHHEFFRRLMEGCRGFDDLPARLSQVSFVVFNYDRCLEQFLVHAIAQLWHVQVTKAEDLVGSMNILHPYGDVGVLSGLRLETGQCRVKFGQELASNELIEVARGIQTFSDGGKSDVRQNIHETMKRSTSVVFLGFGFHDINEQLLTRERDQPEGPRRPTYATGYGVPAPMVERLRGSMDRIVQRAKPCELAMGVDCLGLVRDYPILAPFRSSDASESRP